MDDLMSLDAPSKDLKTVVDDMIKEKMAALKYPSSKPAAKPGAKPALKPISLPNISKTSVSQLITSPTVDAKIMKNPVSENSTVEKSIQKPKIFNLWLRWSKVQA